MANINYEIIKKMEAFTETAKGWTKELNLISQNNREPKYDLRRLVPGK